MAQQGEEQTLDATVVTFGPLESGVEHVGWSSDGADGPCLIVMRSFDDADGYCLVTEGQGTFYGGVEAFEVDGFETRLRLSEEAASTLGVATDLVMRDVLGAVDPEAMTEHLAHLLKA